MMIEIIVIKITTFYFTKCVIISKVFYTYLFIVIF